MGHVTRMGAVRNASKILIWKLLWNGLFVPVSKFPSSEWHIPKSTYFGSITLLPPHKNALKISIFFYKSGWPRWGPYICLTNAPLQPECVTLSVTDRQFPWEQSCFSLCRKGFAFTLQTLNMTCRSYLNVIRQMYFTTRGHSQRHHNCVQHSHLQWQSRRHVCYSSYSEHHNASVKLKIGPLNSSYMISLYRGEGSASRSHRFTSAERTPDVRRLGHNHSGREWRWETCGPVKNEPTSLRQQPATLLDHSGPITSRCLDNYWYQHVFEGIQLYTSNAT